MKNMPREIANKAYGAFWTAEPTKEATTARGATKPPAR